MVQFGEFLKTWSLRSNRVTRQVSFNRSKNDLKMPKLKNSKATFRVIFKHCVKVIKSLKLVVNCLMPLIWFCLQIWWKVFYFSNVFPRFKIKMKMFKISLAKNLTLVDEETMESWSGFLWFNGVSKCVIWYFISFMWYFSLVGIYMWTSFLISIMWLLWWWFSLLFMYVLMQIFEPFGQNMVLYKLSRVSLRNEIHLLIVMFAYLHSQKHCVQHLTIYQGV